MTTMTRNAMMVEEVRQGNTLATVGERHGVTRERVRQIVAALDPKAIAAGQRARAKAAPRPEPRKRHRRTCPVCGAKFTTTDARRRTDSAECAEEWGPGGARRRSTDGMASHQDNVSATVLRRPDKYGVVKVRWAMNHRKARGLEGTFPELMDAGRLYLDDHEVVTLDD